MNPSRNAEVPPEEEPQIDTPAGRPQAARSPLVLLLAVAVGCLTLGVFWPVMQNGLVDLGDPQVLYQDPGYRGLRWQNIRWMFTTYHTDRYQPLTWLSYAIDGAIWAADGRAHGGEEDRDNPGQIDYHFTSLFLHSMNAALVCALVVRLLTVGRHGWRDWGWGIWVAGVAGGLLFALHPLRVEAVAWASQRSEVLSAFFCLTGVLAYLEAREPQNTRARRGVWLVLAVAAVVAAVLAKTACAALVGMLIVLDYFPLGRLGGAPGRWFGRSAWPVWREKLLFAVPVALVIVAAFIAKGRAGGEQPAAELPWGLRCAQSLYVLSFGLWKTAWPVNLAPFYELPDEATSIDRRLVFGGAGVIAVGLAFWVLRRRWAAPWAAWLSYAIMLVPAMGVFRSRPYLAADRWTYMACIGWTAIAGAGLAWCAWACARHRARVPILAAVFGVTCGLLLVLSVCARKQCGLWRGSLEIWQQVARVNPEGFQSRMGYGRVLAEYNLPDEASAELREAVRLRPDEAKAHRGLAETLVQSGDWAGARRAYNRALELDPDDAAAHFGLGALSAAQDEYDDARMHLEAAQRLEPDEGVIYLQLGGVLKKQGRLDEAVARFREALERGPLQPEFYHLIAEEMMGCGRYTDAVSVFRRGLERGLDAAVMSNSLAWLLATCPDGNSRDGREALELATRACELTQHRVAAYVDTLAAAYAELGQFDRAVATQKAALQLAEEEGRPQEIAEFRERLRLFEDRKPYREDRSDPAARQSSQDRQFRPVVPTESGLHRSAVAPPPR